MITVEFNKKQSNPFYGMQRCLNLFQNGSKGSLTASMLSDCFSECKTKEQKEMFYSLLFSIGDITGRQHNIFGKTKVDGGGTASREAFQTILSWLKSRDYKQYSKFLHSRLFNEYNSFDILLANRIQTKPKTPKVQKVISSYSGQNEIDDLSGFLAEICRGKSPFDKMLVAKFLTRPRTSKRSGHKKLLPETKTASKLKSDLIKSLSDKMGWGYKDFGKYIVFDGFYNWRKEYNGEIESVLFSSGKIKEFDQQEFLGWLNKLPAGARYRVKRRLFDAKGNIHEKWMTQAKWFQIWETSKVESQSKQRVLEEKARQGTATQDEKETLVQVKKDAKVTTGAINFKDIFVDIIKGTVDKVKLQPFLDKINLPYNTLVFADDSGSMDSPYGQTFGFSARQFAAFIATICLTKNPDDVGRNLVGLFSSTCRMFGSIEKLEDKPNSILKGSVRNVSKMLVDPEKHFLDNLKTFKQFLDAHTTGQGTNVSSIPESLNKWVAGDPIRLEILQQFPVWTLISDGNFNNLGGASSSLNDFFARCQKYFGFKPFIVAIDVAHNSAQSVSNFSGIENFMFIPPNPAQIEQFLTNFKDTDIMDVYTPLLSLHRSNRYELVRKNVI